MPVAENGANGALESPLLFFKLDSNLRIVNQIPGGKPL